MEDKPDWPVVEGRYKVGDVNSPVAVCTMASVGMDFPGDKIAISGKCVTENHGIEKMVKNIISNPNIRYLIMCGKESMGHFVDNAVESLISNGVNDEKRIIGAKGGIPVLKNLKSEEIERFRKQVTVINMAGELNIDNIMGKVEELRGGTPGPLKEEAIVLNAEKNEIMEEITAEYHPLEEWVQDPSGYFEICIDPEQQEIVVDFVRDGKRVARIRGRRAEDIYHYIVKNGLVSRMDHAAYVGKELANAETSMKNNLEYVQDEPITILDHPNYAPIDMDGKRMHPLPRHGRLISVKHIEETKEAILTYIVNDREIPTINTVPAEEERFKDFLRGLGMSRVF
jgi:tetrahydromethanopterin S-methyltransferase subunit A